MRGGIGGGEGACTHKSAGEERGHAHIRVRGRRGGTHRACGGGESGAGHYTYR